MDIKTVLVKIIEICFPPQPHIRWENSREFPWCHKNNRQLEESRAYRNITFSFGDKGELKMEGILQDES
jgi:hypothetical protein